MNEITCGLAAAVGWITALGRGDAVGEGEGDGCGLDVNVAAFGERVGATKVGKGGGLVTGGEVEQPSNSAANIETHTMRDLFLHIASISQPRKIFKLRHIIEQRERRQIMKDELKDQPEQVRADDSPERDPVQTEA